MVYKKIECENGWIVFIVNSNQVVQVHSNGLIVSGSDDRGYPSQESDLIGQLEHDALYNNLHSQQPGKCGIRWSSED